LFRSEFFFRTTQELEYFFLSRKARIFFPVFNIRLYNKNSESDYFFFPPPRSEYFFQQHWESEYFFRKKPYPPFKLNGRSLMSSSITKTTLLLFQYRASSHEIRCPRDRGRMVVRFITTYIISAYHH